MTTCFTATPGVDVITTTADIPALGSIAINAFVLHGSEPVLVDTGTVAGAPEFMGALASVIDPAALRWIWLTHTDFDHIGSLAALLQANPHLRVITSFLGVGIMGLSSAPLPMDRVHLINPGQSVTVGDRRLTALKPPVYDNPITTGFVDDRSGILFSSDCFGALLPAVPQDAADLHTEQLQAGQVRWATVDSPWVHRVDRDAFGHALDRLRAIEPTMGVQQSPAARPRRHARPVRRIAGHGARPPTPSNRVTHRSLAGRRHDLLGARGSDMADLDVRLRHCAAAIDAIEQLMARNHVVNHQFDASDACGDTRCESFR